MPTPRAQQHVANDLGKSEPGHLCQTLSQELEVVSCGCQVQTLRQQRREADLHASCEGDADVRVVVGWASAFRKWKADKLHCVHVGQRRRTLCKVVGVRAAPQRHLDQRSRADLRQAEMRQTLL